jgi:hypothetical protein
MYHFSCACNVHKRQTEMGRGKLKITLHLYQKVRKMLAAVYVFELAMFELIYIIQEDGNVRF